MRKIGKLLLVRSGYAASAALVCSLLPLIGVPFGFFGNDHRRFCYFVSWTSVGFVRSGLGGAASIGFIVFASHEYVRHAAGRLCAGLVVGLCVATLRFLAMGI